MSQLFTIKDSLLVNQDDIGASVFQRTKNDAKLRHSVEDKTFIKLMEQQFIKNDKG